MNREPPPCVALPHDLSDEAAAKLLEILYEIARIIENHYAGQLFRYYHPNDDRQPDLWDHQDPPF